MLPKLLVKCVTVLLLVLSLLSFGNSLWIYTKAQLAQVLIAGAWQQTLQSGVAVTPWPWADTWPTGRLQIPSQQIDLYTLYGLSGNALAFGPGQLQFSASSSSKSAGAVILAGHRDTHFRFMKNLKLNDSLFLTDQTGHITEFVVIELGVKDSRTEAIEPVLDSEQQELWLVTCYPFDAISTRGPLRYIARALATLPTTKSVRS